MRVITFGIRQFIDLGEQTPDIKGMSCLEEAGMGEGLGAFARESEKVGVG